MGGMCVKHGEKRNAYKIQWETRKEREYLVVIFCRWEDDTGMDLQEILHKDLHWIDVAQGRGQLQVVVNAVMKVLVP